MKPSLVFAFVSLLAVSYAVGQSEPSSKVAQRSTQDQEITNGPVAEYVSGSSCTIGWSTSLPGTMALMYGTDPAKLTQRAEAMEGRDGHNHHVRLSSLTPNTRYYFRVLNAGEPIGGVGTFQTVSHDDPPIKSKVIIPQ
jgi:phosphodiesterase/alkaline phosphatase D-like protein